MNKKKVVPIGIDDFKTLQEQNYHFVDKSLFIHDIITGSAHVSLITRPRRFGKTLNMSMLKCFLDLGETNQAALFKELEILKHKEFCQQFMGKHPVFFISLKGLSFKNKDEFLVNLKDLIVNEYTKYSYLIESNKIIPQEKTDFLKILEKKSTLSELKISLQFMTKLLHKHHGIQPFLLIDEYDHPIHSAYAYNQYDECIDFMRDFYTNCLKSNPDLYKAVLTGILRVSKESIFSGLNNIAVYSVLRSQHSQFFGITEPELVTLLKEYNLEEHLPKLQTWYNGYRFGETSSLYNPWSIMNWLADPNHKFFPYWVNTSSNVLVKDLFFKNSETLNPYLSDLFLGKSVTSTLEENTIFTALNSDLKIFLGFLLHTGYLKIVKEKPIGDTFLYELAIPNQEVKTVFKQMIDDWFQKIQPRQIPELATNIANALFEGNVEKFAQNFQELVLQVMSYHDFAKHPESVFHAFVAGFLAWLMGEYDVSSNKESGLGRYDICLIPRTNTYPAYIFEFKALKIKKKPAPKSISKPTITKELNAALKQINEKIYSTDLKARKIKLVKKIALVFYKKQVWVKEG